MCFFVLESLWAAGAGWADTDFMLAGQIPCLQGGVVELLRRWMAEDCGDSARCARILWHGESRISSCQLGNLVGGGVQQRGLHRQLCNAATRAMAGGEQVSLSYPSSYMVSASHLISRSFNIDMVDICYCRVFNGPHTGDVWLDYQDSLPPDGRVAAIQLYSDKTRLDNRGRQAHPITACLMNIGYTQRQKSLRCIGFLPIIDENDMPPDMPDLYFRPMKLALYAACYRALLQPLREWSYCGKVMADPWGRNCLVFPRFFSFVHDSPEAMDMLCVRGGSKRCAFPCTRCKVPGQELHNLDSTYEARTEAHHQAVFGRLADASLTATARSQLSQDESTQPVASGLWGWAGLHGGANRAFYPEGMHVFDLG
ncbi:uncharacterized protein HaLaN_22008, partial [Haematococcus lacustris]